jgi:SAM-dependent methyltransferase
MTLSELVNLRNQLAKVLDTSIITTEIEKNYARLQTLTNNIDQDTTEKILAVAEDHKKRIADLEQDTKNIGLIYKEIQDKITLLSSRFFQDNYQTELKHVSPEFIRKVRVMPENPKFIEEITQRINLYSNWKYPALEIGCRDGDWTKLLVASDPLYIADVFPDFLTSAVNQFPEMYQSRVRKYLIHNFYKIDNLPKNQFGLIFSFNFFNYLSVDSIKQLLLQAMEWLRPGGTIIFTYNNADLSTSAGLAESYFMTYVPESILVPMAESIGFETVTSYNSEPSHSFIEFKKPGVLNSIKSSQALGEIKHINR